MANTTEATSRSGRTIRPSFKRKAAELGEKTAKAIKKVFKKKKKSNGDSESDSPHEDDNPPSPSSDTRPASRGDDPSIPQAIDLVEPNETEATQPEDGAAKLERLRRHWISPVYAFYLPEPEIGHDESDEPRPFHDFICANKGCNKRIRRYLDKGDANSTGNLGKHARRCWKPNIVEAALEADGLKEARKVIAGVRDGTITAHFERTGQGKQTYSNVQLTKAETRAEIVRWVAESFRPFSIVSDRGLVFLMKTGRPHYYLPSPWTVSRDVRLIFARTRQRIAAMLQKYEGRLSFATDAWTSPNHRAYVAITVHLVHNGKPLSMVLDIVKVPVSHTGLNLARVFARVLDEFGISDKILSITCDNASNNDVMIVKLQNLLPDYSGVNRSRCFLHVVNLIAKSIVKQFDSESDSAPAAIDDLEIDETEEDDDSDAAEEEDDDSDAESEVDANLGNPENDWVDERTFLSKEEQEALKMTSKPVRQILAKLRKLAYKIINSTTKLGPAWEQCVADCGLDYRLMPRDVATRWNSTFDLLHFAMKYREAVDKMTSNRKNDLRKYEMDSNEWEMAKELHNVLGILKDATTFFSRATPNLPVVIPAMDLINEEFKKYSNNTKIPAAIRAAIQVGRRTLNRYYSRTDDAEIYRIAMVLHPRYKLAYFRSAKWPLDWINTAREIVEQEYERNYLNLDVIQPEEGALAEKEKQKDRTSPTRTKRVNRFDALPSLAPLPDIQASNELKRYLDSDVEDIKDPISWWYERRDSYPRLSRMALDYLAIPATSIEVERLFSRGRLVISHVRSRLSTQSSRALICLGVWSRLGLIKSSDIKTVSNMQEVEGDEHVEMEDGWDRIVP